MTILDFLRRLQGQWKLIRSEAIEEYSRILKRFDNPQRMRVWYELVDTYTKQSTPAVADILQVGCELGILSKRPESKNEPHTWDKTDCPLCKGEGRLAVWSRIEVRQDNAGRPYHHENQVGITGLAEVPPDEVYVPGIYSKFWRCSCPAGEAPKLPKSIRRYKGGDEEMVPDWVTTEQPVLY